MRKTLYVTATVLIMLIISRFAVRIIDATVQIGDDFPMLILFLVIVNAVIAAISRRVYQKVFIR